MGNATDLLTNATENVKQTIAPERLTIGNYTIRRIDPDSVWIDAGDGEGGQFWNESFFEAIDEYYKANF